MDDYTRYRLCVDVDVKKKIDFLTREKVLIGKNRDKFIFAMLYGYKNNFKPELNNKDTGGFWRLYEGNDYEAISYVLSIAYDALNEFDLSSDDFMSKALNIAERYANGGFIMLSKKVNSTQYGTFWEDIRRDLKDVIKDN